jgi:hypothetical protein
MGKAFALIALIALMLPFVFVAIVSIFIEALT